MASFPLNPAGYTPSNGWRPLRNKTPIMSGWDVYEWQTRLVKLGYPLTVDGVFGTETEGQTRMYQGGHGLTVDGIAGSVTQTTSGVWIAKTTSIPRRVQGQAEKESSLLCGIYTAVYSNGSQDRGFVQLNSKYHADDTSAFDVRLAVPKLVTTILVQKKRYVTEGVTLVRAWAAAQGYWNNQVYANRYAHGEPVPESFLSYIAACTAYVP